MDEAGHQTSPPGGVIQVNRPFFPSVRHGTPTAMKTANGTRAGLPDDLLVEILCRLPAKSFLRFKCVAKSWLDLISCPAYQKKFLRPASGLFLSLFHLRYANGIEYISLSEDDDGTIDKTLGFLPKLCNMEVIYCCNGLLLCRSWVMAKKSYDYCVGQKRHYVCNPATRVWAAIPPLSESFFQLIALGFDPHLSHDYHILGFDSNSSSGIMIFSSKTGKWMKCQVCWTSAAENYHVPDAVYLHRTFLVTNGLNQVLRVDLEGKVRGRIELPGGSDGIRRVTHSRGYLHYLAQVLDKIEVWILKDYSHGEWVLAHCFSIKAVLEEHLDIKPPSSYSNLTGWEFRMEFHPEADIVFLLAKRNVLSYHINSGELQMFDTLNYSSRRGPVVYSPYLSDLSRSEGA